MGVGVLHWVVVADELVLLGCSRTGDVSSHHGSERLKVFHKDSSSFLAVPWLLPSS